MKKRSALIAASVLAVVILLALVVPSLMDWNKYKGQAIAQVKAQTGLDLVINGDINLGILPSPHLSIADVILKAPAGSARDTLASIKNLKVSVAFLPLLSGKIEVGALNLEEPQIILEKRADGQFNYMTPELQAKMNNQNAAAGSAPQVSLSNVTIEKGSFTYIDTAKGSTSTVENFDADVSADTLQGPYKFTGTLKYGQYDIAIDGDAGRYNSESKTIVPKVTLHVSPGDIEADYTGAVTLGEGFTTQGETVLRMKNLAGTLKDFGVKNTSGLDAPFMLKGLLTATPAAIQIKDMSGNIGGDQFSGTVNVAMNPMKIDASFKTPGNIDADKFLPASSGDKDPKKPFTLDVLPKTLNAPAGLNASLSVEMGSLTWRGQTYNGVTIAGGAGDKTFPFAIHANEIPGKGTADVKGALSYASESTDKKTGAHVLSGPSLDMTVAASTANLPFTLQSLAGSKNDIPYANLWQRASLKTGITMQGGSVALKDGTASLDDMQLNIAGSYIEGANGTRPKASIALTTSALNWDALQAKMGGAKTAPDAQKPFDPNALAQSLKLPFDLTFDVGAQNIVANGYTAGGVRGKGTLLENSLNLEGFTVNNFADANMSVAGKIADLKALSGIDMTISGTAQDVKKLAQTLKIKTDSLPAQISSASIQSRLSGTLASLAMTTNLKAMDGEVLAQGTLVNPLTKLEMNALKLQIKHPNMAQAIRIFSPGFNGTAALNKPMDLYTEMNRTGDTLQFSGIKGNLAGTSLAGTLSVNNAGAKPAITGSFQLGSLVLQNAPPEAATAATGAPAGQGSGEMRWSREAIDTSWMTKADADLDITAQAITYGNWNLQKPVLKLSLKNGELNVSQLNAGLYGGSLALTGKMRSGGTARQPLYIEGNGQFTNVSVEEMVKGLVGTSILKATGDMNMDMKITSSGISPAALIYDLAGSGTVTGKSITLDRIDVARFVRALSDESKPGDSLLNLWKGTATGNGTSFDTLDGAYTITEGVVTISKMDLDGPKAAIATTGTVNLPRWTIATKHKMSVKDRTDIPPFEVSLSGSLDNPAQTFGQGVLQDYLNRKIERKLGSVITDKLGDKGGAIGQLLGLPAAQQVPAASATTPQQTAPSTGTAPAAQQPQTDPTQEAVKGLLKGLLH